MLKMKCLVSVFLLAVLIQGINSDMSCFAKRLDKFPKFMMKFFAYFCRGILDVLDEVQVDAEDCSVSRIDFSKFQGILEDLCSFDIDILTDPAFKGKECSAAFMYSIQICTKKYGMPIQEECRTSKEFLDCVKELSSASCGKGTSKFFYRLLDAMASFYEGICAEIEIFKMEKQTAFINELKAEFEKLKEEL